MSLWWQPVRSTDSVSRAASGRRMETVQDGRMRWGEAESGRDPATGFHTSVECIGALKLGGCRAGTGPVPQNSTLGSLPSHSVTPRVWCHCPQHLPPPLPGQSDFPASLSGWLPNASLTHHLLCQSFQPLPPCPIYNGYWTTSANK